ncbi:hypothetical protein K5X82_15705 [Halosquirtibacter xylanolyticus]|uniref:hypothetical protein n=1 Tax=Halosquirtibacter xylanolyticus TaxID=3374599 RepID=UPI003749E570|nr:hypothetical protein K5X82_15705 [Prolixibacteraceae bacterium]
MNFSLKKTTVRLSISYKGGSGTDNLFCNNVKAILDSKKTIEIDFHNIMNSAHLESSFEDLKELIKFRNEIDFIRFNDAYLTKKVCQRVIKKQGEEIILRIKAKKFYELDMKCFLDDRESFFLKLIS